MSKEIKIHRYNYDEMMPGAELEFPSMIAMPYCAHRDGPLGDGVHFGLYRYLYFDDIIALMERKIKAQSSGMKYGGSNGSIKTKKLLKKWNSMLQRAMENKNIQANKAKENQDD